MRIVFFGTPEFAVPSLRALLGEGFDVAAVVTQPDRPRGRSRSTLIPSPVKAVAEEEGLTVLQPERPSGEEFLDQLRPLQPDIGVVVAYGHILKPALLALPTRGMINVHASLLPALRGAAPIEHAILLGLDETGVTIMQMEETLDTGPIIHQVSTPIAPDETGGELTVRLAELGALALVEALALIATGKATPKAQDDSKASYAPKITRDDARIRWNASADEIARIVRAFDPRPGAWTTLGNTELKLFGPRPANEWEAEEVAGQVVETDPAFVV
ncbi:MAG: methionyl-tRNA formyltransferase, partial [Gemmatimonadales bacterium]